MRRREERKNEDRAKDERGEKKGGRGWRRVRGDGRWEIHAEERRTVQGVKKKKKKKKLRWSSAGSITTAAGGDDLLKATRSQPLGPKRETTLLIFRCSLFSLSAPYSFRALSLPLSASFLPLSLFLSLARSFARFPCICLSWARWTLHGPFSPSFYIYLAFPLLSFSVYSWICLTTWKIIKYREMCKTIQRSHVLNFRFFSLKSITSECMLDEWASCFRDCNSLSFYFRILLVPIFH